MTFGNAVELILSIVALLKGLYIVVEYSLIGSVLSNLLLVLGESPVLLPVHKSVTGAQRLSGPRPRASPRAEMTGTCLLVLALQVTASLCHAWLAAQCY